jgi:hypothetical protein
LSQVSLAPPFSSAHDQIDLAAAAAGRAKIRLQPAQAALLQMRAGKGLGPIATTLVGRRPAR